MPGISRDIAEHRLFVQAGARPVQQRKRRLGNERQQVVKAEVERLLLVKFVKEVQCPEWIANTVLGGTPQNRCLHYLVHRTPSKDNTG